MCMIKIGDTEGNKIRLAEFSRDLDLVLFYEDNKDNFTKGEELKTQDDIQDLQWYFSEMRGSQQLCFWDDKKDKFFDPDGKEVTMYRSTKLYRAVIEK